MLSGCIDKECYIMSGILAGHCIKMSITDSPLKDLKVGDIIYANVIINKADMVDQTATSGTAKK